MFQCYPNTVLEIQGLPLSQEKSEKSCKPRE